ncbi:MAG: hypothetical protein J0I36_15800, partial [Pandoraea sp.]|nr:hypothetical protein [Pandoraea sp.]
MRDAIFDAALDPFSDHCRGLGRIMGIDARKFATSDVVPLTIGIDGTIKTFVGTRRNRPLQIERAPRRRVADVVPGKPKRLHHKSPSIQRQRSRCRPM